MLKQKSPPKMYRKHAVKAGVYHQTYIDPNTEDVHRETVYISPQYLRQSAWNTMQMMKRNLDVPVCLDHQDDAYPKKTGQWLKDEMKTAVGLMRGVKYDPKREELEYEYEIQDPAIANKIDQGIIKKVSPNFHASFSPGDGTVWNNVIGHLALTFRPKDYRQGSEPMVATVNVTAPKGQQRFSILSVAQDSIIKLVPMYKLPFGVLASMAKKTASGIEFSSADYNFKFKSRPEFIAWLNKRYRHTLKMSVAGKQGHILYFAVIHAPVGGVHINGRKYLGGQFIPNSHVDALPTAERDKVRAGSAEMLKKRAANAGKYVGADETHKSAVARHAGDHAKAEMTPEDKKAAMRRWASLRGYHGDNALQEVAALAGKEAAQLAKLDPASDKAKHIQRRLRAYHEMAQLAKPPATAPMQAAASESSEAWAAKDNSITMNGKEVAKYDFDRDSDSFWVDNRDGAGQKSFETKKEMLDYIKEGQSKAKVSAKTMAETQPETDSERVARIKESSKSGYTMPKAPTKDEEAVNHVNLLKKEAKELAAQVNQKVKAGAPYSSYQALQEKLDAKRAEIDKLQSQEDDGSGHKSAMSEMADAAKDFDDSHAAKIAADRKQRIMESIGDDHEHLTDEQKQELASKIDALKKDDQEAEDEIANNASSDAYVNLRKAESDEREASLKRRNEEAQAAKTKMLSDNGLTIGKNGQMAIDPENLDKAEIFIAKLKMTHEAAEEDLKTGLGKGSEPNSRTVLTKSGMRISRNDLRKSKKEIENYEKQVEYHKKNAEWYKTNSKPQTAKEAFDSDTNNPANSMPPIIQGINAESQKALETGVNPPAKINSQLASRDANSASDKPQDTKEAAVDTDSAVKKVFGFGKDDLDKVHQGMFNQDVYAHNESYGKARASARINNHIGSVISDIDKKVKAGTATPEEIAAYDAVEVDKHYGDLRSRLNDLGGVGWQQAMTDDLPKSISADELAPSDSRYTSALRGAGAKADPNAYAAAKREYESNTKAVQDHQAKLDEIHSQRDKLRDLSYNAEKKGRRDLQEKYDKKRDELMEEAGKIGDDKLAAIDKNNASRNKAILSHPELPDFVKYAHIRNKGYTGYVNKDVYEAIEKPAIEHAKKNGHDEDVGRHLAEQLSQGVSLEDPESLKKYLKRSSGHIENQKSAKNEVARMKAIEGYDALDDHDKEKYERRMMANHDYPQAVHNDVRQAIQRVKEEKERETALEKKLKYDEQLGKEKSSRLKANISKLRSGTADDLTEDHVSEAVEHAVGSQFAPHTNFKPGKNYKAADYHKEAILDHKRYSSNRTMAEKGTWTDGKALVKVPKAIQDQAKKNLKDSHARSPDVDTVYKMSDKQNKVPAKVHASYGDGTDKNKHKYVIQSEHGHVVVPHESHDRIMSLHPDAVPYLPADVKTATTIAYRNAAGDIVGVAVPLSNAKGNQVIQAPEVGEKIELGGIAEPGPHKEDAMKAEKSYRGTKVSHPVAGGAELHVTGKSGEYEISGFPGKYKSPAHAVKAAKHILSFAHGMKTASGPLIFKPKGSKGNKDKPSGNAALGFGVVHAPAGGADAQGKHYLGGQFVPNDAHGSGQRPAKKAVAPVMQQKRSFYTKADAHARNLNLKPVIAQVPGMGQVKQAYQHGNLLIHPSKDKGKWQVTHAPTGKRVGSATYKNDAIRKAYLLHHGLDWNFMGDADAHHKARFEDVAKGSIPRGLDEGSLQPGGITEDHNNQSKRLETWMKHAPNYQQAREKYIATHGSFDDNGQLRSISANIDDWRDFIPGYNGINAPDTHAAAKYANERFLDELLTTMKDKGNRKVAILGGGGGSGKGTAVASHFDEREYPVRLDQTSSDYDSLMQRVKKIKEHGMEPDLVFIDRKPRDAWQGVVARSANLLEKGQKPRVVPKHVAVQANIDARKVALRIAKEHPDLPLRVIDNHNGYNQSKLLKDRGEIVRHLEGQDYNINDELQEADNHVNDLEKQGKLPGHVAAGLRGK